MRPLIQLLLLSLFLSSCATVFSRSYDILTFNSLPEGAEVWIDGKNIGKTPVTKRLDRDTFANRRVTIRHDRYEPAQFTLSKSLNKVAIFNSTLWPSWITDALSGSMIMYAPDSYFFELKRAKTANHTPASSVAPTPSSEKAMEREELRYLMNHYQEILKEIARGGGEHLKNHWSLRSDDLPYDQYLNRVKEKSEDLLVHKSPIELQKKLKALNQKEVL